MKQKEHYGLGTAISMIIGIAIGSGIFFKVDDILMKTGGSVWLGVLVFVIGAFCIIFGSITLSQLASRTKTQGGVISYYEEFISPEVGNAFGWFQVFVYYPTLSAVISWVAGVYTLSLLNLPATLELQTLVGFLYMSFFFLLNYLSYKSGGLFQVITTIAKMIPLVGVGIVGLFWTADAPTLPVGIEFVETSSVGWGWLAALAPMAFSFDGWIVSTTITQEVKNHKRNMPIALVLGPLLVLIVYLSFFLGVVSILSPEFVLSVGDQTISQVGYSIFGAMGERILLFIVLLAVLGVVNGVTLGYIRMPQILSTKQMLPFSKEISQINPERGLSRSSALFAYSIAVFWLIIHYFTQKWNLINGGDISEIAVVFSYLAYILLYVKVIDLKREGLIKSIFLGVISPVFGILGSLIILVGGLFSNFLTSFIFILFSSVVCYLGYRYSLLKQKNKEIEI